MPKAIFKSDDELFEAIQRCRTSGMTDKDWCAANGISQTALYRYIRKLKVNASQRVPGKFQTAPLSAAISIFSTFVRKLV